MGLCSSWFASHLQAENQHCSPFWLQGCSVYILVRLSVLKHVLKQNNNNSNNLKGKGLYVGFSK